MYANAPEYSGDPLRFSDRLLAWLTEAGEPVAAEHGLSLLDHSLQTAELAQRENAPNHEVVTALLHDTGKILLEHQGPDAASAAPRCSEKIGAAWLARYFPPAISEPVRLHQIAKRWLFALDKGYRDTLSDEAFRALAELGGPMGEKERQHFERHESWSAAVALARRDDMSRMPLADRRSGIQDYRQAVADCLSPQSSMQISSRVA